MNSSPTSLLILNNPNVHGHGYDNKKYDHKVAKIHIEELCSQASKAENFKCTQCDYTSAIKGCMRTHII